MFSFLPEYERRTEAEERESDSKDERLLGTRRFSWEGRLLVAEDMMGACSIELELDQLGKAGAAGLGAQKEAALPLRCRSVRRAKGREGRKGSSDEGESCRVYFELTR